MENELATLGLLLAAIITPISTIALLKIHNANKLLNGLHQVYWSLS